MSGRRGNNSRNDSRNSGGRYNFKDSVSNRPDNSRHWDVPNQSPKGMEKLGVGVLEMAMSPNLVSNMMSGGSQGNMNQGMMGNMNQNQGLMGNMGMNPGNMMGNMNMNQGNMMGNNMGMMNNRGDGNMGMMNRNNQMSGMSNMGGMMGNNMGNMNMGNNMNMGGGNRQFDDDFNNGGMGNMNMMQGNNSIFTSPSQTSGNRFISQMNNPPSLMGNRGGQTSNTRNQRGSDRRDNNRRGADDRRNFSSSPGRGRDNRSDRSRDRNTRSGGDRRDQSSGNNRQVKSGSGDLRVTVDNRGRKRGFESHMEGPDHKRSMRDIETKTKERIATAGDRRNHCVSCNIDYSTDKNVHQNSSTHRVLLNKFLRKGCKPCGIDTFTTYRAYGYHVKLDSHIKKQAIADKKNSSSTNKEDSKKESTSKKEESTSAKSESPKKDSSKPDAPVTPKRRKSAEKKLKAADIEASITKCQELLDVFKTSKELPKDTEPMGVDHVAPVTGYFCKICNKFYNNKETATVNHCLTKGHLEKFEASLKKKLETAQAAEEKEKKEAEDKKAAEEKKKAEKEEKKAAEEKKKAEKEEKNEVKKEESKEDTVQNENLKEEKKENGEGASMDDFIVTDEVTGDDESSTEVKKDEPETPKAKTTPKAPRSVKSGGKSRGRGRGRGK